MWKVNAPVVLVAIGALGTVTPPKLGERLQQIPAARTEISVQKRAVLGTAKIMHWTFKL